MKLEAERSEVNHQSVLGGRSPNLREGLRLMDDINVANRARKSGSFDERQDWSSRYGRFLISVVVARGLMNTCRRAHGHINQCHCSCFPL